MLKQCDEKYGNAVVQSYNYHIAFDGDAVNACLECNTGVGYQVKY